MTSEPAFRSKHPALQSLIVSEHFLLSQGPAARGFREGRSAGRARKRQQLPNPVRLGALCSRENNSSRSAIGSVPSRHDVIQERPPHDDLGCGGMIVG